MTAPFDKDYWDQIWGGDRAPAMSTGAPNPHLVAEVGALEPGTALEAGCGAGAEAIWLATQGWTVTAADVAEAALTFAEERAAAAGAGAQVDWVRADLSTWEPQARYDLVTTHYAHPAMPQLEFYDRIASWVGPHGTLLIVGHLHDHRSDSDHRSDRSEGPEHRHGHGRSQPPAEASVTAAAITARLDPADWDVVTAEESQRTMVGADGVRLSTVQDVVVRATRRD